MKDYGWNMYTCKKDSGVCVRKQKTSTDQQADLTHPYVVQNSLKLQRLILSFHRSGVQAIASINKLDDVTGGAANRQVVLRAQIFQRLHQTPLSRHQQEDKTVQLKNRNKAHLLMQLSYIRSFWGGLICLRRSSKLRR